MCLTKEEKEILLEEYKSVVQLVMLEGESFWKRYEIFLVLNVGLLTGWTYLSTIISASYQLVGLRVISVVGFLSCTVSFFSGARGRAYQRYFRGRAKCIEEQLEPMQTFRGLDAYLKSKDVWWFEKIPRSWSLLVPLVLSMFWVILSTISYG